ncbi:amidohydrolase family protein [bacterium]|nr:amidohydrolase family protein [bacterium]
MNPPIFLSNATLLTMRPGDSPTVGSLRIEGKRITDVGSIRPQDGDKILPCDNCVVLPGFIQTHIHLSQTLFRNTAENLSLLDWLMQRILPYEAAHDAESIAASTELAIAELFLSGTTTVLTMEAARHTDSLLEVVERSGLRAIVGKSLVDKPVGIANFSESREDAIADVLRLKKAWHGRDDGRIEICLAPRFALGCSESLLHDVVNFAAQEKLRIHTHASENYSETQQVRDETGLGNIEYLHSLKLLGPTTFIAHCIHLDPSEIELLAQTGTHVLHCPTANLKLGSGIAPIPEMLEKKVSVTLGSDGAPCNNTLDIFREMSLAVLIQSGRLGVGRLNAPAVLEMATRKAAEALGKEKEIGTLEAGKLADVVVIDLNRPNTCPSQDIEAALVHSAMPQNVRDVFVNGRRVVSEGTLTEMNIGHLMTRARENLTALLSRVRSPN